jgi:L-alanine-DL-glutamate epimerase-like enolase superfamily enzyme
MTEYCPITDIELLALQLPPSDPGEDPNPADTALIVRITDAEGRSGIGEADGPAEALRSLFLIDDRDEGQPSRYPGNRGIKSVLIGRDPFEIEAIWSTLYQATMSYGRRGLGLHALAAVDVALYDLVGKQLGRPAYQLLGGALRTFLKPYGTVWCGPNGDRSLRELMDATAERVERAKRLGFSAIKVEALFEERVSDRELVSCIREWRDLVGDDTELMLDFGYRWNDWRDALWVLTETAECNLYFAEATLRHDDLLGHAKLAARVRTRVCGAEFASSAHECEEWLRTGRVDIVQPDISRCGGLTEVRRVADMAARQGAGLVTHSAWKTGVTATAALHLQASTANTPYIEMFPAELSEGVEASFGDTLIRPVPSIEDGIMRLPTEPGLGISLDEDILERWSR